MERFRYSNSGDLDLAQFDDLPFGCILVDEEGIVLFYNQEEERNAARSRDDVLGKNFFTDIAPCAQVRDFHGRFKRVVADTGIIAMFDFRFPLVDHERNVHILMSSFRYEGKVLCLIVIGDLASN